MEMVLGQLVERSLPTPEIRGLNPVGNFFFTNNCIKNHIVKPKIKKKRPGMTIKTKIIIIVTSLIRQVCLLKPRRS